VKNLTKVNNKILTSLFEEKIELLLINSNREFMRREREERELERVGERQYVCVCERETEYSTYPGEQMFEPLCVSKHN